MLLEAFGRYPGLAKEIEVAVFFHAVQTYGLRAKVCLKDDSSLSIRDFLFEDGSRKYSYHWQSAGREFLGRWDNAPHWPSLSTFPNHFHNASGGVEASLAHSLVEIIGILADQLNR